MSGIRSKKPKPDKREDADSKQGSPAKGLNKDCWMAIRENLPKESQVLLGSVDREFNELVTQRHLQALKPI